MTSDEQRIKHLEWIQSIISRQAANSFLLKGWSITLVAGLLALAAKDSERSFVWLTWFPVVAFYFLDAFYLFQERRYVALFDWVQRGKVTAEQIQTLGLFCLKPDSLLPKEKVPRYATSLTSPATLGFYSPLLVASLLIPAALSHDKNDALRASGNAAPTRTPQQSELRLLRAKPKTQPKK